MLRPNGPKASERPSQEALLLDYAKRLERHRKDRLAVHIRLSNLKPQNRREHHIRIAANTFESLVKLLMGQLFLLTNSDFVFIYKGLTTEEVESAIYKLRFLFSDDPLLAEEDVESGKFVSWYKLEREYDSFIKNVEQALQDEKDRKLQAEKAGKIVFRAEETTGEPLNPELLGRMEDSLQRADLSNLMRRQAVCVVIPKMPPQPVFSELYISIKDLRDTLMPDVNLASNRWLFQHLTEVLDRRMLSLLNKNDDSTVSGSVSINMNVATLLSPLFLKFDDSVKAGMRGTLLVELQKIDIFADLGAYFFARDFLHERGYRVVIDGMTHLTLPFVDRERLGADLVKLIWNSEMAEEETRKSEVHAALKRTGDGRVILCRCDNTEAVAFGQSVGITMFQGRHVENLLAEEMRKKNVMLVRKKPR